MTPEKGDRAYTDVLCVWDGTAWVPEQAVPRGSGHAVLAGDGTMVAMTCDELDKYIADASWYARVAAAEAERDVAESTLEDGWCMGCGKPFHESVEEARAENVSSRPGEGVEA